MRDEQFIESRTSWYRWIAFTVFFVSGFAALLYQVIWQRLLMFIAAELAILIFGILSKGFFYDFLYTRHPELAEAGIDVEAMIKDYLQPGKVTAYGPDATRPGPAGINTDLFPRDEFDYRRSRK